MATKDLPNDGGNWTTRDLLEFRSIRDSLASAEERLKQIPELDQRLSAKIAALQKQASDEGKSIEGERLQRLIGDTPERQEFDRIHADVEMARTRFRNAVEAVKTPWTTAAIRDPVARSALEQFKALWSPYDSPVAPFPSLRNIEAIISYLETISQPASKGTRVSAERLKNRGVQLTKGLAAQLERARPSGWSWSKVAGVIGCDPKTIRKIRRAVGFIDDQTFSPVRTFIDKHRPR